MGAWQKVTFAAVDAAGVAAIALPGFAPAQKFPTKPVRMVVVTGAGGQPDLLARMLGPPLAAAWGQPVVIDNRPGAGGTLGIALVAKAAPDGHTLLFPGTVFVSNAGLQPNLPYDPLKDFAGVTQIGFSATMLVVAPS